MGILITILVSAFFSGVEIAFYASNKLKIELGKNEGSLSGRFLGNFYKNRSHFLTTLLIGNNIALVIFGNLMAAALGAESLDFLGRPVVAFFSQEPILIMYQTLVSTAVILVLGEFLPKVLFNIRPARTLKFFAIPLRAVYLLMYPLTWSFERLAQIFIRLVLRSESQEEETEFSAKDLEHFIKASLSDEDSEVEDDDINADIFEKALYLRDVKVKECMVPRTQVKAIEIGSTIDELRNTLVKSRHSRILVFDENIDNIKGYTHHFELLKKPSRIEDILFTIPVVPESMSARDLLTLFTRESRSIAWVVDEYGGTAGIVTLEDVMEEIFGEIQDEHDRDENIDRQVSESEFIFSGRLEIDYLNEKYGLKIPEGDYETIAGYVVITGEDIPESGDEIQLDRFRIKVLKAADNKLEILRLKVMDPDDDNT